MKTFACIFLAAVSFVYAAGQTTPKSCEAPEYRQFDFWVGNWAAYDTKGNLQGHNRVEKVYGDCVIQENWRGIGGSIGSSFNIYDATRKVWHQTWVSNTGELLTIEGKLQGKDMVMIGQQVDAKGLPVLNRITWAPTADGVHQVWDSSSDNGKTWQILYDGFLRPAKDEPRS